MNTNGQPSGAGAVGGGETPASRRDVVSARSRMRTKYGAQREIEQVAAALEPGEVLLHLAMTRGSSQSERSQHGLVALSDLRLQYVPKSTSRSEPHSTDIGDIGLVTWSPDPDGRTGTLSIVSSSATHAYAGMSRADGRDLIAGIRTVRPAVRYVEPPG